MNQPIDAKTYPAFPGKEKHLLKAQIVRISTATVLVYNGIYQKNADNDKIIEFADEAVKLPTDTAELKNLDNWVHL